MLFVEALWEGLPAGQSSYQKASTLLRHGVFWLVCHPVCHVHAQFYLLFGIEWCHNGVCKTQAIKSQSFFAVMTSSFLNRLSWFSKLVPWGYHDAVGHHWLGCIDVPWRQQALSKVASYEMRSRHFKALSGRHFSHWRSQCFDTYFCMSQEP